MFLYIYIHTYIMFPGNSQYPSPFQPSSIVEGRNWNRCPLCKEAPSVVWMLSLSMYREPWGSLFWVCLDGCYTNMPPTTFAKSTELKPVHTYNGLPTENWTTELLTLGVIFACINFYGPLGQCFFWHLKTRRITGFWIDDWTTNLRNELL